MTDVAPKPSREPGNPASPDGPDELRREPRLVYRLPVTLLRGREEIPLRTEDVSYHGIFLETDQLPPLRQLLRLRLLLPPYNRELVAHGMVVHLVLPDNAEGKPPGVGVQLYALDRAARTVWDNFVARVRQGDFHRADANWPPLAEGSISFLEPDLAPPIDAEAEGIERTKAIQ